MGYIIFPIFLVDGGWSDWKNVTNCSASCGEGVIIQERTCTQPSPSCGGRHCLGENITNISCNNCCPGNYSEYFDVYFDVFISNKYFIYVYITG